MRIVLQTGVALCLGVLGRGPESRSVERSPAGRVEPTGSMTAVRAAHTATLLPNGKVLITGGMAREGTFLASAELYDPATGRFTATDSMHTARVGHSAILLRDARVLVVSGGRGTNRDLAEIYDVATGHWSDAGQVPGGFMTRLNDGSLLFGSGDERPSHLRSTKTYDPAAEKFAPAGDMSAELFGPATLLRDGRVLVAGGEDGSRMFADAQIYNPASRVWTHTGALQVARDKHAATLLPDGRVLITGGADKRGWRGQMTSTEVYDPSTGRFGTGPSMTAARFKLHASVAALPSGQVLVAGGSTTVEIYDPASGAFSAAAGALDEPRFFSTATPLADGSVLIVGGYNKGTIASTARAWVYRTDASAPSRTSVDYTLTIDSTDLSGISVAMRIHRAAAEFRVAMVAHPEYDDQYWRYVTELRGESARGPLSVAREDSSVWRISGPAGDVTLRYRVRFPDSPPMQQAAWKAHLTPTGGLVGGPHSFLYVLGAERSPVRVSVLLPPSWRIVTGLDSSIVGPRMFSAASVEALVDSPMLVGLVRSWRFGLDGVPHQIAFLGRAAGAAFDTALFVGNVERFARESVRMFGRMPYKKFEFLFEDGSSGGLEHRNSVTIGLQSSNLARNPDRYIEQIAHEFFHTWNEVHVRPLSWIGVRHAAPEPTGELWWSEGVTLYFADLLLRRAGLKVYDSTRVAHLERYIASYIGNPSHAVISAEATSRAFNKPPSATGDYTPSMFTQGELAGAMLDLMIRDASSGRRSLDNAMRALSEEFTVERGITGADVERAVARACGCSVQPFFDRHIRAAGTIEFDKWLGLVGLRTVVTWSPALATDGTAAPDSRLSASTARGEAAPQLKVWFPATLWGRAGIHTGDRVESWNGVPIQDAQQVRTALGQLHIGDTVRVSLRRNLVKIEKTIVVTGYEHPTVKIETRPDASAKQLRLLAQWLAGR